MLSRLTHRVALVLLSGAVVGSAWAQGRIYSCTDAKGRRLTADRPIAECLDREQREHGSNGLVRRTIPPALTASERAEQDERQRKAAEEQQRVAEEKRLHKLLLARYPNQKAHDSERARALKPVGEALATAQQRVVELQEQLKKLRAQAAPYKTAAEVPEKIRRELAQSEQDLAAQRRSLAAQEEERARIAGRYDQELARLKVLWAAQLATAAGPASHSVR